jgi:hypothetical protein
MAHHPGCGMMWQQAGGLWAAFSGRIIYNLWALAVIPAEREAPGPESITTNREANSPKPCLWIPGSRLRRAPE